MIEKIGLIFARKTTIGIINQIMGYAKTAVLYKKPVLKASHFMHPTYIEHLAGLQVSGAGAKMRQAGIICTIGPASRDIETLVAMMENGMNIARLNFAHGSHEYHLENIQNIRQANAMFALREKRSATIGIAVDLQGPNIRTGKIKSDELEQVHLKTGSEITVTTNEKFAKEVTDLLVYMDYKQLPNLLRPGSIIFLDEGQIELKVLSIDGENVKCKVRHGGYLGSTKGVNLPGVDIDLPTLTQKDKDDLKFALKNKADIVFVSCVRHRKGVEEVKKLIDVGDEIYRMAVVAKIENQQGIEQLDDILKEADGVLVARGDLGIELPTERLFIAQKTIIAKCNLAGKPVICATQMLESMIHNPRPTRAESSDIANAVLDGADCVMLNAETVRGKYPVECVKVMEKVCREAEAAVPHKQLLIDLSKMVLPPAPDAMSTAFAAVVAAEKMLASAIITTTATGTTAFLLSKFKPICPIIAITRKEIVARKCHLYRSVVPVLHTGGRLPEWAEDIEFRIKTGLMTAHRMGFIHKGDVVIVLTGWRAGRGSTNTMKIIEFKEEWFL